ncbi:MAG: hypothetical protein M3Q79_03760 [bacterium]|nr:hypothetical protein [bacterium]
MLLSNLFKHKQSDVVEDKRAAVQRNLLRREAAIGGQLFGTIPAGGRREFFCLDERTWIWHEEWLNKGKRLVRTTRYDVRPNAILKAQDGGGYHMVSMEEAEHLMSAVRLYHERVSREIYGVET